LLLLDSHALLWWQEDDVRLSVRARQAIENPDVNPHFSAASVWELAIKQAKRKLSLPVRLLDALADEGFIEIPVSSRHATTAAALPPHHRDPFDRMLVAQAQSEGLTLVTSDQRIAAYGVPMLW
jgi:PIN domain nuclease of toxin-antitoxin system